MCNLDPIFDKFNTKLNGWKVKMLLIGLICILIIWLIKSLGNYYFSMFKITSKVAQALEATRATISRVAM